MGLGACPLIGSCSSLPFTFDEPLWPHQSRSFPTTWSRSILAVKLAVTEGSNDSEQKHTKPAELLKPELQTRRQKAERSE